MNFDLSGMNPGAVGSALLGCMLFGLVYAGTIRFARKRGILNQYVTLFIMGGVAGTVVIGVLASVIPLNSALMLMILFLCSGIPQIIEEVDATARRVEQGKSQIRNHDHDNA